MTWTRSPARSGAAALVAVLILAAAGACSSDGGDDDAGATTTTAAGTGNGTGTPADGGGSTTTTTASGGSSIVQAACDGLLESPETVRLDVPPLVEASGLAVSRANDDVLWAHNDSGDRPRVFAIDATGGSKIITFGIEEAEATDWEDMALGPAVDEAGEPVDQADALYLADIGDNDAVRPNVVLYRVSEPNLAIESYSAPARLGPAESYRFRYPDGPRDAEALFIDRTDGSFYVIEKSLTGGPVGIFRGSLAGWDAAPAVPVTLERVGTFRPGRSIAASVTGADMTPAGDAIAVRTYGGVHLFARPEGTPVADALAAEPCRGPVPVEAQGEAVAVTPAGDAYFTLPEGTTPTLSRWSP